MKHETQWNLKKPWCHSAGFSHLFLCPSWKVLNDESQGTVAHALATAVWVCIVHLKHPMTSRPKPSFARGIGRKYKHLPMTTCQDCQKHSKPCKMQNHARPPKHQRGHWKASFGSAMNSHGTKGVVLLCNGLCFSLCLNSNHSNQWEAIAAVCGCKVPVGSFILHCLILQLLHCLARKTASSWLQEVCLIVGFNVFNCFREFCLQFIRTPQEWQAQAKPKPNCAQ